MLPMKEIAETLLSLYEAREKVKADLYEVSGMSDIIRGNTAPEETAAAQKIKSNFATKRLGGAPARGRALRPQFAVDLLGNIIAVHFSPETLVAMTGVKLFPQAMKQLAQQAQSCSQQLQQATAAGPASARPSIRFAQQFAQISIQGQKQFVKQSGMTPEEVQEALNKPTGKRLSSCCGISPAAASQSTSRRIRWSLPTTRSSSSSVTQFIEGITGFLEQAGQIVADPTAVPLLGELLKFGAAASASAETSWTCA
jgi:hypothetical protein